jgi:predicted ATP-dependent serine protease
LTPKEVSNIARGKAQIAPENPAVDLVLTRAADVEVEAIKWLWNGWLAAGKLHILAGRAGTGKTTVALAVGNNNARRSVAGQYAVFGPR